MTDQDSRPRAALNAVAIWALFQTARISAFPIISGVLDGKEPPAWLYPALVDVFVGATAPLLAFAVWRRTGLWTWLAALAWFTTSLVDHLGATIDTFWEPIPSALLGGSRSLVLSSLAIGMALDLLTLMALARPRLRAHFLSSMPRGEVVGTGERATVIALIAWTLLQISRVIAIPVIQGIAAGVDPTAWLFPAVGDLLVAGTAPVVVLALWRERTLRTWAGSILWLLVSILDHLDTVTAALTTPAPRFFASAGEMMPAYAVPALQAAVDALFILLMLRQSVRSRFLAVAQPRGSPDAPSPKHSSSLAATARP